MTAIAGRFAESPARTPILFRVSDTGRLIPEVEPIEIPPPKPREPRRRGAQLLVLRALASTPGMTVEELEALGLTRRKVQSAIAALRIRGDIRRTEELKPARYELVNGPPTSSKVGVVSRVREALTLSSGKTKAELAAECDATPKQVDSAVQWLGVRGELARVPSTGMKYAQYVLTRKEAA